MATPSLILLGAGKMGGALLRGWISAQQRGLLPVLDGVPPVVIDPSPAPDLVDMGQGSGVVFLPEMPKILEGGLLVLAIKPQLFSSLFKAGGRQDRLEGVVSIMAGHTIATLKSVFGEKTPVIRAMPNTPCAVGYGMTGLVKSPDTPISCAQKGTALFEAVGQTLWLDGEDALTALTALSGSGPAYLFYILEALEQSGTSLGLCQADARRLALATLLGAGHLAAHTQTPPQELRRAVTSPGGVTQAALEFLEASPFSSLLQDAIHKAFQRAKELEKF